MRRSIFLNHVESLEKEDLKGELIQLFDQIDQVKSFYSMELGSDKDRAKVFSAAKKKIERYYATKSFRRPKAPRIKYVYQLLKEVESISIFKHELVDLYLFHCEVAVQFKRKYYFSSTASHNAVRKSFKKASRLIADGGYHDMFATRMQDIVDLCKRFEDLYPEIFSVYFEIYK